jgi:hypothetical protein
MLKASVSSLEVEASWNQNWNEQGGRLVIRALSVPNKTKGVLTKSRLSELENLRTYVLPERSESTFSKVQSPGKMISS